MPHPKDAPLTVKIEDDQLVIRIGIDTLAFCFENSNINMPYDEKVMDFPKVETICHPLEFAKDVRLMLLDEREDGSSVLTDLLDKACVAAVNDGSLGVTDKYLWGK
jgi:hypothetical protein